jgi:hypothetical protein
MQIETGYVGKDWQDALLSNMDNNPSEESPIKIEITQEGKIVIIKEVII